MHKLNVLFILTSLSVLIITLERFSFTTEVLLQPNNFIRLHEIVQMTILILITIVLPLFLLYEVTDHLETLKRYPGNILGLLFIIGIYFYATGNGVHEISSFFFNTYCNPLGFSGDLCNRLFINNYYTGNILFFTGGALMIGSLLLFEKQLPNSTFHKRDMPILFVNAFIYALAICAYAAFDRVPVGLIYSLSLMIFSLWLFVKVRMNYLKYPIITYTTISYTLGAITSFAIRAV